MYGNKPKKKKEVQSVLGSLVFPDAYKLHAAVVRVGILHILAMGFIIFLLVLLLLGLCFALRLPTVLVLLVIVAVVIVLILSFVIVVIVAAATIIPVVSMLPRFVHGNDS